MTTQGTELELVPPAPVAAVDPAQATTVVPVDPAVAGQLEATADAFAVSVTTLDIHSPEFTGKVGSITRMGDREMRDAAAVSNRMLERPVKAMGSGLFDASSPVSKSLIDLRNT
ncbi:MAG: toxic anion resistance protein, partial [Thermoleophilia bacterium]